MIIYYFGLIMYLVQIIYTIFQFSLSYFSIVLI